jgi:putative ABC transport system substrate-binding protein
MRRRALLSALVIASLGGPPVTAQEVARVGILSLHGSEKERIAKIGVHAIVPAMASLGYSEGRNLLTQVRHAEGDRARLRSLAEELVKARVQVIVAVGTDATRAASDAAPLTPIVMAGVGDPVGAGYAVSLARPGGDVTGTSLLLPEMAEKMLDNLKQAAPHVGNVAVLRQSGNAAHDTMLVRLASAAPALGLRITPVVTDTVHEVSREFARMRASGVDGFVALPNPALDDLHNEIGDAGVKQGLPGAGWQRFHAASGFLLSYGPSLGEMHARAALYVDKIIKGARPAELPVEQAERFTLVVNLTTAKALGIKVSETLLARADEVIE